MTGRKNIRFILPDVLKGLAVVLMIQVHIMEQFVNPEVLEGFYGRLSLFLGGVPAAPVFMIIMGYFISYTKSGTIKLVKRGFILFAGGILLNAVLNLSYIIRFIKSGYPEFIYGSIFGVDILPLAGLSLIIIAGLIKISKSPVFLMTLALLVVGFTPLVNTLIDSFQGATYLTAFFGGTAEWSYFPVFPWLAYPLAGLAVHAFGLEKWRKLPVWIKGIIAGISLGGLIFGFRMGFNISTELSEYYHHNILFFLWALSFVSLMLIVMDWYDFDSKPLNHALLSFMGREVTLIYIIQWILIGNLAAWTGKQFMLAGHIALFLGISLGTVLLAFLYRKLIKVK